MTRKEAIKVFSVTKMLIQKNGQEIFDRQDIPLIDMAIEALQTDAVSREHPYGDDCDGIPKEDTDGEST